MAVGFDPPGSPERLTGDVRFAWANAGNVTRSALKNGIVILGLAALGAALAVASFASGAVTPIGGTYSQPPPCQGQIEDGLALQGDSADDTMPGTAQRDLLSGGGGDDKIYGKASSDCVAGAGGNDEVSGGPGDDRISGGFGDDTDTGGSGNDRVSDGAGVDTVRGGPGNDRLFGGAGNDRLFAGGGVNLLNCGSGDDVATANPQDTVKSNCETVHVPG